VFSLGIWWIGFKMNRSGFDAQIAGRYTGELLLALKE
jgi:hypothetical protein